MISEHLWPAGSILATLTALFASAMGARLGRWARDSRLLGPWVRWLFPVDPPVSIDPPPPLAVRDDALLAAMQEGLRAAGMNDELRAVIEEIKGQLQQLTFDNQELLEAVNSLRSNTYTMACTITPQAT